MNFRPRSSQDAAQFGFVAARKFVLRLDGVDRNNGEFISALEGDGLYVERTDYPFMLTYISSGSGEETNFIAKNGAYIPGPFKGMVVSHPLIQSPPNPIQGLSASLLLSRGQNSFDNQFSHPYSSGDASINVVTLTALQWDINVYVPPGSKYLKKLRVDIGANGAGIITANWLFLSYGKNGGLPFGVTTPKITLAPNGRTYPSANYGRYYFEESPGGSYGGIVLKDGDLPVPSSANEIAINISGSALPTALDGFKVTALFA